MKLSIIVPCFNEEKMIFIFYQELMKELKGIKLDYELIFIDDGSKDKTLAKQKEICLKDEKVKVISFSRNFGKESAMLAGLEKSIGDYVVIMDVDLQDPPSLLDKMISILNNKKYDSVATYRVTRDGEPVIRSCFASLFYKLINKFTNIKVVDGARDYRMMTRKMVDSLLELKEYNRFSKGLFVWIGYKTKYLEYENIKRKAGESKWNFWKLFKYAVEGIVSFTTIPLRIATIIGLFISLTASIYLLYIIIDTLINDNPVSGWPSMACIILFLGGIQLLALGIMGEYIARIYDETKKRSNYIIKEYINND